jgi:hypothetical protein
MSFASKKLIPKPSLNSIPRPSSSASPPPNINCLNNMLTIPQKIANLESNLERLLKDNEKIAPLLEMGHSLSLFKVNEERTKDIQKNIAENDKDLEELKIMIQKFGEELNSYKGEVTLGEEKDLNFKVYF